jgi:hypothetical protein
MLKGIMLEPDEPDWQDTMAKREAMQAQQQQQQAMMQQQQPQGPPPGMMQNAPDLMGQMTPESMGDPSMDASMLDMMQGGGAPSPEQLAYEEMVASGGRGRDRRPQV